MRFQNILVLTILLCLLAGFSSAHDRLDKLVPSQNPYTPSELITRLESIRDEIDKTTMDIYLLDTFSENKRWRNRDNRVLYYDSQDSRAFELRTLRLLEKAYIDYMYKHYPDEFRKLDNHQDSHPEELMNSQSKF